MCPVMPRNQSLQVYFSLLEEEKIKPFVLAVTVNMLKLVLIALVQVAEAEWPTAIIQDRFN